MTERNNHTIITVIIVLAIIVCVFILVRNPFGFSTYSPASAASFSTYSTGSYPSSASFSTYPQNILSFNDCINAGYQVIPTYPEQCRTPGGQTFTQVIQQSQSTTYYPPTSTYYPPTTTYYPQTQYQYQTQYYPPTQTAPTYQGNQGCYVNGYWMQSCPQD